MTRIKHFDLEASLLYLDELTPESVRMIALADLEWILSDFILSWGQRLLLQPEKWPEFKERERARQSGARYLPFSIASDFPTVTTDQVRMFGSAFTRHALFNALLDEIIDEPETVPTMAKLILQPLVFQAHCGYQALFPPDSLFWNEAEKSIVVTTRSMWQEHSQHNGLVQDFSLDEFRSIAIEKATLANISRIGLSVLNGTPQWISTLNTCFDAIAVAAAVQDDIRDWRHDYQAGNYTYLLSQVLLSPPFRANVATGHLPSPGEVGAALMYSDFIESLYNIACLELQAAIDQAAAIHCPAVAAVVRKTLNELQSDQEKLTQGKLASFLTLLDNEQMPSQIS
jgi:hypothetical protein